MSWRQSSTKTKASVQHCVDRTETALNSADSQLMTSTTAVHYIMKTPTRHSTQISTWLCKLQIQMVAQITSSDYGRHNPKKLDTDYISITLFSSNTHFTVFNILSSNGPLLCNVHWFTLIYKSPLGHSSPESESVIALLRTENQNDCSTVSRSNLGCHLQGPPHHHSLKCCPILHTTFAASCTLTNHSSDVNWGLTVQRLWLTWTWEGTLSFETPFIHIGDAAPTTFIKITQHRLPPLKLIINRLKTTRQSMKMCRGEGEQFYWHVFPLFKAVFFFSPPLTGAEKGQLIPCEEITQSAL